MALQLAALWDQLMALQWAVLWDQWTALQSAALWDQRKALQLAALWAPCLDPQTGHQKGSELVLCSDFLKASWRVGDVVSGL